jgi:hypothetical protein
MDHYPHYQSKHVLVMFTNTSYSQAYQINALQKELLEEICKFTPRVESIDWPLVDKLIDNYDKKLAKFSLQ